MKLKAILVVAMLSLVSSMAFGTDRYVELLNGVDNISHGSSADNAYKTINFGISQCVNGDRLFILQGTYMENVSINGLSNFTIKGLGKVTLQYDNTFLNTNTPLDIGMTIQILLTLA